MCQTSHMGYNGDMEILWFGICLCMAYGVIRLFKKYVG